MWLIKSEKIQDALIIEFFIIFVNYGGFILVVLTAFFWHWSGMASLGIFYLIFVAPITMCIIVYRHHREKTISNYHKWAYVLGLIYVIIVLVIIIVVQLLKKIKML